MEGKWIKFVLILKKEKTSVYNVVTKDGDVALGQIRWFGQWRKHAFFPYNDTVYEATCLTDIVQFMNELMRERNNARLYHKDIETG